MNINNDFEQKNKAIDLLRNYTGENPYLLDLRNEVFLKNKTDKLTDFNTEYILKNFNFKPKLINKIVKITDWYSEKLQKDFDCEFKIEKIQIKYLLGETENAFHVLMKYRKNMEYTYAFLSKKGVMTNFTLEDYHNLEIDFERYDKLSNYRRPDKPRKILDYQKEGIKFLLSRKKCILADGMGMGKSLELSVASVEGNFDSVLIICPASLKSDWFYELSFYVPEKDISIIGGTVGFKKEELEKYLGYGIGKSGKKLTELQEEAKERGKWDENRYVIVNYDILDEFFTLPASRKKVDIEASEKNSPLFQFLANKKSLIIVDEAHNLSNTKTNQYKIVNYLVKHCNPDSVYLATGTPITNDPSNYYSILSLIENNITSDWQYYIMRYCNGMKIPKDEQEKQKRNAISSNYIKEHYKNSWYDLTDAEKKELNEIIEKNVKLKVIPKAKEASNLDELMEMSKHIYLRRTSDEYNDLPPKYVHEKRYNLTEEQMKRYNLLWEEYEKQKKELDPDKEINKDLLEGAIYRKFLSNQMVPNTIKLTEKCLARGEKVIIVCCYDEELYTLRDYFGDKCVIYNGKLNSKQEDEAKYKFLNDDNCRVFIGNIIAAGFGLTLTVSRIVIFNNFDWVPGNCRQMEDRVYRIGQKRDCHIFYQFFNGTQYEKMWDNVLRKELVINQIIKKENEK